VNTAPTSYGKVQLSFATATTKANLSGVYAGTGAAANATSLKLELRNNATIGSVATTVRFRIRDQNNNTLFSFNGSLKAGDVVYLGSDIGLSVSFTAGTAVSGQLDTTTVSKTVPTDVDPSAVFDAADPNLRPRFEGGAQLAAGSFQVNGVTVSVLADDNIQSVLARVAATVPGVTGTFSGDRVTLETSGPSEQPITVGNDTSGFLSAVKLLGGTSTIGNVHDDVEPFALSNKLGSVQSGSFRVNGVTIAVDRATDSLQSVLARINAAGAGVTASYDVATDRVVFTPDVAGARLVLDGDTSGFLAAVKVPAGARGTSVEAQNPFDGTGMSDPLFDAGLSVQAGSFTVNDVLIEVAAQDSVSSVLAKINASGAGVTATLSGDRITLSTNAASEADIVLAGDTSGFLAATKLAGATTARGNVHEHRESLATSPRLGSVATGSFTVNGVAISVDRDVDSLESVLARVTAAGVGVAAIYDVALDRVVFTPDTPGATLSLENDTSGLLAAVGVAQGTVGTRVNPDAAFDGVGLSSPLFDPGYSVTAGSFTVNGVRIDVAASDSVNSVLAQINASAAGVTATLDAATQTVRLEGRLPLGTPIALGADSSGFLAAVKLDGTASSSAGLRPEAPLDWALPVGSELESAGTGEITINGQAAAVSPQTITLREVVDALDEMRGVRATVRESTSQIRLTSDRRGGSLDVRDTSGLLAALHIETGVVRGRADSVRKTQGPAGDPKIADPREIAGEVGEVVSRLNEALAAIAERRDVDAISQDDVLRAAREALGTLGVEARSALWISEADGPSQFKLDARTLAETLKEDPAALGRFLQEGVGGVLDAALLALDRAAEAAREAGPRPLALALARRAYGLPDEEGVE
jgi:hypothetical protein